MVAAEILEDGIARESGKRCFRALAGAVLEFRRGEWLCKGWWMLGGCSS
jgi:hypothetical protein